MAKVKGLEELNKQLEETKNLGDKSGDIGELKVIQALEKFLPEDSYIIIQPEIGSYIPDILIISPQFGFRIIEVKNWNLKNMQNILPNGSIQMKNHSGIDNPLSQVRKHVDTLNRFLKDSFNLPDQYKNIGFMVIFPSIKKDLFIRKFSPVINNWSSTESYFKHYIFQNQLVSDSLVSIIKNTTRFNSTEFNTFLTTDQIEKIVKSVHFKSKSSVDEGQLELLSKKVNEIEGAITEFDSSKITKEINKLITDQTSEISQKNKSLENIDERFAQIELLMKKPSKSNEYGDQIDEIKSMIKNLEVNKNKKSEEQIEIQPRVKMKRNKTKIALFLVFILFIGTFFVSEDFKGKIQATYTDFKGNISNYINDFAGRGKIKGNINEAGERIYHLPDGEYYESTIITPETGERYFDTEEEAQLAGFRPASEFNVLDEKSSTNLETINSNVINDEDTEVTAYDDSISAVVYTFKYDKASDNKYLTLSLNGDSKVFDAIIKGGTLVPYINEGERYTFHGQYEIFTNGDARYEVFYIHSVE